MTTFRLVTADVLAGLSEMAEASVRCVVTSPPYWGLRDYGVAGQLGLESTPDEYVAKMVTVFREVRRVLRDDGTLWLNIGDSYSGRSGAGTTGVAAIALGRDYVGIDNNAEYVSMARRRLEGVAPMFAREAV